jgi:hypothetical protein
VQLWAGTTADELAVERRWLTHAGTDDVLPLVYAAVHGSTARRSGR